MFYSKEIPRYTHKYLNYFISKIHKVTSYIITCVSGMMCNKLNNQKGFLQHYILNKMNYELYNIQVHSFFILHYKMPPTVIKICRCAGVLFSGLQLLQARNGSGFVFVSLSSIKHYSFVHIVIKWSSEYRLRCEEILPDLYTHGNGVTNNRHFTF